jgi:hypothetical protein
MGSIQSMVNGIVINSEQRQCCIECPKKMLKKETNLKEFD